MQSRTQSTQASWSAGGARKPEDSGYYEIGPHYDWFLTKKAIIMLFGPLIISS